MPNLAKLFMIEILQTFLNRRIQIKDNISLLSLLKDMQIIVIAILFYIKEKIDCNDNV